MSGKAGPDMQSDRPCNTCQRKWRASFREGTMIDLDFECSIPKVLVILAESEGLGHLLDVT